MILPIKQQFASPKLCKRLVELGAPAETACLWVIEDEDTAPWIAPATDKDINQWAEYAGYELVPAYSVAELGELLRPINGMHMISPWEAEYGSGWQWYDEQANKRLSHDTEANIRITLILHLARTGQLTFPEPHHA